jgi:hypothetical protein
MERIALFVSLAFFIAHPVYAIHTVTFQPDGAGSMDAMIRTAEPDTNYGNLTYVSVGVEPGQTTAFSLIKFTGLDAYVGATLVYAELNLYCYDRWIDEYYPGSAIYRVANAWTESGVTWNNRPDYDDSIGVTLTIPDPDGWSSLDVTSIVETWLNGSFPHNGFYLVIDAGGDNVGGGYFYSGEYDDDPDLRPYLYMLYSYTDVAPVSFGALKAVFR